MCHRVFPVELTYNQRLNLSFIKPSNFPFFSLVLVLALLSIPVLLMTEACALVLTRAHHDHSIYAIYMMRRYV
jgi:hypothetical protein